MNKKEYADRYFLWKDPMCNGKNAEWIEMTKEEYIAFRNVPDKAQRIINRRRRFEITEDDWDGNRTSAFEVTIERYREWDNEQHREAYQEILLKKEGISFVSFDAPLFNDDGEDFCLYDIIPSDYGKDKNAEEMIAKLKECLKSLTEDEMRIIDLIYLENDDGKSVKQIASEIGMLQQTLNYQKNQILKKLKELFCRN